MTPDALQLVALLEQATEGSRELDRAIKTYLYPDWEDRVFIVTEEDGGGHYGVKNPLIVQYTTSLDAALTLVPEGWIIEDAFWSRKPAGDGSCCWELLNAANPDKASAIGDHPSSFALALVIAALKARIADGHK